MPKLRDATITASALPDRSEDKYVPAPVGQTSGVDKFGNEFTLRETDIQPYIDNPEIAQMEADVTQARYGGSTIQGYAQKQEQQQAVAKGPTDFSNRGRFENSVFKQLASENMPSGNPFGFNVVASTNATSKRDLPDLFEREFQGQVSWQDRHLLDDEQRKFWLAKTKEYRAHINTGLKAERAAAISSYNQMMNQFDNAAKEQQAADNVARQKQQAQSKRRKGVQKGTQDLTVRRRENLAEEGKLIQNMLKAEDAKGIGLAAEPGSKKELLQTSQTDISVKRLQAIRAERKSIDAELQTRKTPKPKSAVSDVAPMKTGTKTAATPGKIEKKGTKTAGTVRKKVPAGQRTIVGTGMYKGRKVVKYSDGSKEHADET